MIQAPTAGAFSVRRATRLRRRRRTSMFRPGINGDDRMIANAPVRHGFFCLSFVAILTAAGTVTLPREASAQGPTASVNLAPHVAIYDLKLTSSRGKRS